MRNQLVRCVLVGMMVLTTIFACIGCGTASPEYRTSQFIHVENQNHSRIKAYIASESAPDVRVLLGTIDAWESEDFSLPSVFQGNRALVVYCEIPSADGRIRWRDRFQSSYIALPPHSTLVVTVHEPIINTGYSVHTEE